MNRSGNASASVYTLAGDKVAVIPEKYYNAGDHLVWDGKLNDSIITRLLDTAAQAKRARGSFQRDEMIQLGG